MKIFDYYYKKILYLYMNEYKILIISLFLIFFIYILIKTKKKIWIILIFPLFILNLHYIAIFVINRIWINNVKKRK